MKRYFRKSKKQLAAYTLSALFTAAIGVSQAFLLQYISETAMAGASQGIPLVLVLVAGYLVLDTASDFAYGYSLRCACTKIAMDLRNDLLRRIQKCPIEEKEQKGDGFYLSMLNDQVGEVEEDYVGGLLQVLFQIFSPRPAKEAGIHPPGGRKHQIVLCKPAVRADGWIFHTENLRQKRRSRQLPPAG